jgi:Zn-dependent M16 (insulinase) family peptidase
VLYHDLFTSGIVYLDVGFNLHTLSQDLVPYLPLFSSALVEIGTETEDFVKLTQRIGRKTGGIRPTSFISAVKGESEAAAYLFLRSKATLEQTDDLLDILRDILLTVKLDNQQRVVQMLLEQKAGREASLAPAGHRIALSRLRAKFTEADWAAELTGGVSQIFFLRRLVDEVQQDWPAVLGRLEEIRRTLINRNSAVCNITLDSENWTEFEPRLAGFLAALPAAPANIARWVPEEYAGSPEGLTFPAKVNYVAKGANLYDQGYELHGSCAVITHYLRATYLWERIRVQGGAYGAFCAFNRHSGLFTYGSYRDPNLLATLDNYDQASEFLRNLDLADDELTKSIIGAIGAIDAYQLPDAKGYSSMQRHLIDYTDEERQAFRDEVFATKVADFRSFAGALDGLNQSGLVVALGSEDAIKAANAERDHMFTVTKVL